MNDNSDRCLIGKTNFKINTYLIDVYVKTKEINLKIIEENQQFSRLVIFC
jgi:hypothetical protein